MEPSDFWDDVSNCRCGDRLMSMEQQATRQHQRCLAHSLVGTPNYIAPEVLLRKGQQDEQRHMMVVVAGGLYGEV